MTATSPRVGLFVTCLVDLFRPTIGFAAVKLLEEAGCTVEVPMAQTCCGQPAYNSGDRADSRAIAENTIRAFEDYDYVVAPSGSCAGMLKKHYPGLFKGDAGWERAPRPSRRRSTSWSASWSTCAARRGVAARLQDTVTYHDSCSGLRELGVQAQPRRLLASIDGVRLVRDAGRGCLLRLRRHVLREISRDLQRDRRRRRPTTSPPPAPTRCSPAISAA